MLCLVVAEKMQNSNLPPLALYFQQVTLDYHSFVCLIPHSPLNALEVRDSKYKFIIHFM